MVESRSVNQPLKYVWEKIAGFFSSLQYWVTLVEPKRGGGGKRPCGVLVDGKNSQYSVPEYSTEKELKRKETVLQKKVFPILV